MRIFGIDPGSERTGYGCVETDGRRHQLVACGAIAALAANDLPQRLERIHRELTAQIAAARPDCIAIENIFHATNARSALLLGHARGVAMLAAAQAGCAVVEYTPAEIKRAVVGYGRAEKHQVQQMIKLLLGLAEVPSPHDAADALAVAICHLHSMPPATVRLNTGGAGRVRLKPDTTPGLKPDATPAVRLKPDATAADATADVVSGFSRTAIKVKSWRQYRPPTQG